MTDQERPKLGKIEKILGAITLLGAASTMTYISLIQNPDAKYAAIGIGVTYLAGLSTAVKITYFDSNSH